MSDTSIIEDTSEETSPEAASPTSPGWMGSRSRRMMAGAGVLALAAGLAVFVETRPTATKKVAAATMKVEGESITLAPDAPQWRYVELAVAAESSPLPPLPAPGHVDFDEKRSASVGTPLGGRVERIVVRLGDRVKENDKLFSVRSGAWAELERDLATAEESVLVKKRLAERAKELVELKASPEKEVLAAESELKAAQLAFRATQAKRASFRIQVEGDNLFWVLAPRSGTLVDFDLTPSQEVSPDREKPLLRISDLGEVIVLADVQENDAYDLKVGSAVKVHTHAGNIEKTGTLERISEVVDPKRRTVEVRIRMPNEDHALRPNSFVDVTLATDASNKRVRVPTEAVVTEGDKSMVFVARGPGRLERMPVTPGRQRDGEVELRAGLEPGSRFVSKGAILLLNQIDLAD